MIALSGLFMVLVIAGIVFAASKVKTYLSWRMNIRIVIIYLLVLLISVPILYRLPQRSNDVRISNSSGIAKAKFEGLNPNLTKEQLDKQNGFYKNGSQEFPVESNVLKFYVPKYYGSIVISRKNVDDGRIDVSTYVGPQIAGDIDFTKLVSPPKLSYRNGTLSIQNNKRQSFELGQFVPDFTVNQFKNQDLGSNNGLYVGTKVVYLRIPKSMEIENSVNANIQMLSNE